MSRFDKKHHFADPPISREDVDWRKHSIDLWQLGCPILAAFTTRCHLSEKRQKKPPKWSLTQSPLEGNKICHKKALFSGYCSPPISRLLLKHIFHLSSRYSTIAERYLELLPLWKRMYNSWRVTQTESQRFPSISLPLLIRHLEVFLLLLWGRTKL